MFSVTSVVKALSGPIPRIPFIPVNSAFEVEPKSCAFNVNQRPIVFVMSEGDDVQGTNRTMLIQIAL